MEFFFSSNVAKNKSKKIENLEKSQNTFFVVVVWKRKRVM